MWIRSEAKLTIKQNLGTKTEEAEIQEFRSREREREWLTKAESISIGRHELLIYHNDSNRTDNIHSPRADIGNRRRFLLPFHFPNCLSLPPSHPQTRSKPNRHFTITSSKVASKQRLATLLIMKSKWAAADARKGEERALDLTSANVFDENLMFGNTTTKTTDYDDDVDDERFWSNVAIALLCLLCFHFNQFQDNNNNNNEYK